MENLPDYSNYVMAAYIVALSAIFAFSVPVMWHYFAAKKNLKKSSKNEK